MRVLQRSIQVGQVDDLLGHENHMNSSGFRSAIFAQWLDIGIQSDAIMSSL